MDESWMNAEALTQAILARTSGSPCERLHTLACDFVDGALDEARSGLLRGHMDHCASCAALVRALAESSAVLPAMADVDPGPWFTQRVLRTTSRRPLERGFDARALWRKLLHRPRIALETAYLGAALGVVGLQAPVPWHSLRAPAVVRNLAVPAQRVVGDVVQGGQRTAASLRRIFPARAEGIPSSLWQRATAKVRAWIRTVRKTPQPANP